MQQQILHYPNLKTVFTIEKIIQEADTVVSKNELKRRLPTQIMHQTLNLILEYLEESGKIIIENCAGFKTPPLRAQFSIPKTRL